MRGSAEILFRLRQETADLRLLLTAPGLPEGAGGIAPVLPDATWCVERLRGGELARDVEELADSILTHRFPILGVTVETGPEIDWRRDYLAGVTSGTGYCRLVRYLDFAAVGDHKVVWELNRHQHLVVLAQAFRFTGRREYLDEIVLQIRGWLRSNPFMRGINWASALEVAFRVLSWTWVYHMAGQWLPPEFQSELAAGVWRHAVYLRHNLSVHFSPNTHLLGEAVALHAVGVLFPSFPGAADFAETGRRLTWQQMERQVHEDGSHFEQSSYYHVYAMDFFLLHQALAETPPWYRDKLARMGDYLDALLGPDRRLPFLGDDDGGRVFHPYGPRETFGRATLATCALSLGIRRWQYEQADLDAQALWWLGGKAAALDSHGEARASRLFANAGIAMLEGAGQVIVDAGAFGAGTAGHSHSDTLSVLARWRGERILDDAGTYRYMGDESARNWFRGTAAHNTIRIDHSDQALPAGPFRWLNVPEVEVLNWETSDGQDCLDAACSYRGFSHRRRILFARSEALLFVLDIVEGPRGDHLIELFWHPGEEVEPVNSVCFRIGRRALLTIAGPATAELAHGGEHGWRSKALYQKCEAPVILARARVKLPALFATVIDFDGTGGASQAELHADGPEPTIAWSGAVSMIARFGRRAILDRK